jgi:hypothetical protein
MVDSHYVSVTSGAVTTVTLDGNYSVVEVVSMDGAGAFSVAVDPASDFVVTYGASGTYPMPAAVCSRRIQSNSQATTVVKLIASSATVAVCVLPADI